jgi:hypothetical protein
MLDALMCAMQVVVIAQGLPSAHNRACPLLQVLSVTGETFETEYKAGLVLLTAAIQNLERVRASVPSQLNAELQQQQRLLDSALWQFQRALSATQR